MYHIAVTIIVTPQASQPSQTINAFKRYNGNRKDHNLFFAGSRSSRPISSQCFPS